MIPDLNRAPDLNRPEEPVYRPSRGGMDPATRRLAIIAGFIGAILLALVGGWSLTGHHSGGVPVIEADTTPIRVKPVDPGGMQLSGAEPPPSVSADGSTTLAPGPETPDPQALHAELDRAREAAAPDETPAATPAPVPAPAPAAPAPPAPAPSASETPAPATTATVTSAARPAPARPAATGTGRVEVQLAAMDSQAQAEAEWQRLSRKSPSLFADRTPLITEAQRGGHTFYRLRTSGFETMAAATEFCARSRAAGAACTIASF